MTTTKKRDGVYIQIPNPPFCKKSEESLLNKITGITGGRRGKLTSGWRGKMGRGEGWFDGGCEY